MGIIAFIDYEIVKKMLDYLGIYEFVKKILPPSTGTFPDELDYYISCDHVC